MSQNNEQEILRVLAIDPHRKGFGYAIVEAPDELIDWGNKEVTGGKNWSTLLQIHELIEEYQPSLLLVEDTADSHRCERIRELIDRIVVQAVSEGVRTCKISQTMVRKAFATVGCATKEEIARTLARYRSELARSLPASRKPWTSEDPRMSIFDSVAMTFTYFHFQKVE